MMKFPEKIKIGGHEYTVIIGYNFKERNDLYGQCDNNLKEIRVCTVDGTGNQRPEASIIETFLHELLHAIENVFCAGQEINEAITEGLGQGLTATMVDNPEILKTLWDES